jgi:hypothetical protein
MAAPALRQRPSGFRPRQARAPRTSRLRPSVPVRHRHAGDPARGRAGSPSVRRPRGSGGRCGLRSTSSPPRRPWVPASLATPFLDRSVQSSHNSTVCPGSRSIPIIDVEVKSVGHDGPAHPTPHDHRGGSDGRTAVALAKNRLLPHATPAAAPGGRVRIGVLVTPMTSNASALPSPRGLRRLPITVFSSESNVNIGVGGLTDSKGEPIVDEARETERGRRMAEAPRQPADRRRAPAARPAPADDLAHRPPWASRDGGGVSGGTPRHRLPRRDPARGTSVATTRFVTVARHDRSDRWSIRCG